jgi:Type I phosphodiesterase / nucleotide pyrophosphatase
MTASIPLRTPSSGQAVRGNGAYGDDDAAEAQGLLGQGGNGQGRGDDGDEEDASWLLEEEEAMVRSLKQDRNRKRRARAYTSKDRKLWIAELTAKPWFPAARVAFFGLFGISALVLSLFSLGSLWHTTTSHAPGAPTSSSHPPKDKTRSATSLLPANEKSNGTHPWRKTVILLSIDGAKPQYFDENKLPHLQELGLDPPSTSSPVSGLLAANMQPRFPTLTFPNHWTLLTGLNAESHGIVANDFTVAPPLAPPSGSSGRHFKYTDPLKSHDGAWWGGTPLWATAERAGVPSAVMMWPGPPRTKDGDRPSLFVEYSGTWTNDMRLERIQEWIGLPVKKRPQVMCGE